MKLINFKLLYDNKEFNVEVPNNVHLDLYNNGIIEHPYVADQEDKLQWVDKLDWTYTCNFNVDDLEKYEFIVFEGVDTFADIYINNVLVGNTTNMFLEYRFEIINNLKVGNNELKVIINSPIKEGIKHYDKNEYHLVATNDRAIQGEVEGGKILSPHIRKAHYHFGWDWAPRLVTSGIYKNVYLKEKVDVEISDIYYELLSDNIEERAVYDVHVEIISNKLRSVKYIHSFGENKTDGKINLVEGVNNIIFQIEINNPQLWWPNGMGNAFLYDTKFEIEEVSIEKKIGIKTVKLIHDKDRFGRKFQFIVNGKAIYAKGANHIPNSIFNSEVTDAKYEREIELARIANFNMIRVWGGGLYEGDAFYNACDEKGIIVWHDFMFACCIYPNEKYFYEEVEKEAIYQVKRLRNHASLGLWCGNNEVDEAWCQNYGEKGVGWQFKKLYDEKGQEYVTKALDKIFKNILRDTVKNNAAHISYIPSSPYPGDDDLHKIPNLGDDHYWAPWHKNLPLSAYFENIPRFSSEYGFRSLMDYSTTEKFISPNQRYINSQELSLHERVVGDGAEAITKFSGEFFEAFPSDLKNFTFVSQLGQGLCFESVIENYRISNHYNYGSLVWQLNDTWPCSCWSTIDYLQKPKMSHYFLKRVHREKIIAKIENEYTIDFYVVNDSNNDLLANITLSILDYDGNIIKDNIISEKVLNNDVKYIATLIKSDLPKDGRYYIKIDGYLNEEKYSEIKFSGKLNTMSMKQPKIEYIMNGSNIEITCSEFTPYLGINHSGTGILLDNAISVEKGQTVVIPFLGKIDNISFSLLSM